MKYLFLKNYPEKCLFMLIVCLFYFFFFQCQRASTPVSNQEKGEAMYPFANPLALSTLVKESTITFYGKKILAFYKSSDGQSPEDNEIRYHLAGILEKIGFNLEYWDIDMGIPEENNLAGVRAIVSWFRGAAMEDPDRYLEFLNRVINSGRKVVVIDNFGAYQYRRTNPEEYVDVTKLNLTLSKLGLWYLGDWTEEASLIEIVHKNAALVEAGGMQDVNKARFYYRFFGVDRDLNVHLSLKRRDRDTPPSPVIVTNKHGGFILSRYIYQMENGKARILLDFEKFIQQALFPSVSDGSIGLLVNPENGNSRRIVHYLADMFKRVKLPFRMIEKEQFPYLLPGDLNRFAAVGLVLSLDEQLDLRVLEHYLVNGGSVISLLGGYFPGLASVLGSKMNPEAKPPVKLQPHQTAPPVPLIEGYTLQAGLALSEGYRPGFAKIKWQAGDLLPGEGAQLLGSSPDGKVPLVWVTTTPQGGQVLVWNWDGFAGQQLLGLAVESVLYVQPVGACLPLGFGHLFIDDWPLPMYNVVKEPLPVTDTDFYTNIWWPEIRKLLSGHKIPYSTYLIFNYNAIVEPPFTGGEFFVAENMASLQAAQDLINASAEMGFHGYNHMSLTTTKTQVNLNAWPSAEAMLASLKEGKRTWLSLFSEHTLPFAYVAVNNIIADEGVAALHEVFPSIKIVSSLYWGEDEETLTPIGPHPVIPGIYCLPRISSGYQTKEAVLNQIVSGMNGPGLISHFIHPDDVYDPYRSAGKDWTTLKKEFEQLLAFVKIHYPWVQWVDIREAYQRLLQHDNALFSCTWEHDEEYGALTVHTQPGRIIRLRPNRGYALKKLEGGRIVYTYQSMPGLIVEAQAHTVNLRFAR